MPREELNAYGKDRLTTVTVPTDNRFTGQKEDASGQVYMNARYYDPVTGHFASPDMLVPDATNLFDFNRYMYVRGNPLWFTDPTGHFSEEQLKLLGLLQDSVSAEAWSLLLALEPGDELAGEFGHVQVRIGAIQTPFLPISYRLFAVSQSSAAVTALDSWIQATGVDLDAVDIYRDMGEGAERVWSKGSPVNANYRRVHQSLHETNHFEAKINSAINALKEGITTAFLPVRLALATDMLFAMQDDSRHGTEVGDLMLAFSYEDSQDAQTILIRQFKFRRGLVDPLVSMGVRKQRHHNAAPCSALWTVGCGQ